MELISSQNPVIFPVMYGEALIVNLSYVIFRSENMPFSKTVTGDLKL